MPHRGGGREGVGGQTRLVPVLTGGSGAAGEGELGLQPGTAPPISPRSPTRLPQRRPRRQARGEETGWRGYALPQLQRRFSPLTSSLIIAVLWFGWHLPQFFVIASYRDYDPVQYVGMFVGLTIGAVVLTWLYNRSGGSILLVAVWHGLYNFVSGTQAATGMLAAVVTTLIMIQGVVLIVLELRARRRGRPSVLGPA